MLRGAPLVLPLSIPIYLLGRLFCDMTRCIRSILPDNTLVVIRNPGSDRNDRVEVWVLRSTGEFPKTKIATSYFCTDSSGVEVLLLFAGTMLRCGVTQYFEPLITTQVARGLLWQDRKNWWFSYGNGRRKKSIIGNLQARSLNVTKILGFCRKFKGDSNPGPLLFRTGFYPRPSGT